VTSLISSRTWRQRWWSACCRAGRQRQLLRSWHCSRTLAAPGCPVTRRSRDQSVAVGVVGDGLLRGEMRQLAVVVVVVVDCHTASSIAMTYTPPPPPRLNSVYLRHITFTQWNRVDQRNSYPMPRIVFAISSIYSFFIVFLNSFFLIIRFHLII